MSSNTIFSSLFSEKRWIIEMKNTYTAVCFEDAVCPCVFRVPESLTQAKWEAYAPQKLGLGPYHHLRPDLYTMQRKKLAHVIKYLNQRRKQNLQPVVEALQKSENIIRSSYDQYLDLDPNALACILAIDAVYLLQFLKIGHPETSKGDEMVQVTVSISRPERIEDDEKEKLTRDILMLENQIPLRLILKVQRIIKHYTYGDDIYGLRQFRYFYDEVSPLKINLQRDNIMDRMEQGHLLSVMYNLIVTNRGKVSVLHGEAWQLDSAFYDLEMPLSIEGFSYAAATMSFAEASSAVVELAAAAGVPGAAFVQQQLSLMERVRGLFKSGVTDEESPSVDEIDIPSVSQLTNIAGTKFAVTVGGIRDVKFDEGENKLYLPVITLKSNSEVILSNLLAYEAASLQPGSTLELAEYVDLMCGIVDAPKDVEILSKEGIIKSSLTDAEITRIFNGIRKSTGDKEEKTTAIEKAIEKVNEQYGEILGIKAYRFIKKYMPILGKFLTVVMAILVLALFVFQAFCQIYGCSDRWFKNKNSS